MKLLVLLLGTTVLVNAATIFQKNDVNTPIEKNRIIGPSGSITQLKNIGSQLTEILGPSGIIENQEYSGNDASSRKTLTYVSSYEGTQKGTTHKGGLNSYVVKSDDCDDEKVHSNEAAKLNTVTIQSGSSSSSTFYPSRVEHAPVPHVTTGVVGQYGVVTQGNYLSKLNSFLTNIYNTENHNTQSKDQYNSQIISGNHIVQLVKDTATQSNHVVNPIIENTRIVGPSGSIQQEKYQQSSVKKENGHLLNGVKVSPNIPNIYVATNEPSQEKHIVDQPIEKTSITGPSGSIIQKKYHQVSAKNDNGNVHYFVKNIPSDLKRVNVALNLVSQGNHVVDLPVEKTRFVGASGIITKEKHYQTLGNEVYGKVYNVQNVSPKVVHSPTDKTTIVGPSGSITQENYYQTPLNKDNKKVYNVVNNIPSNVQTILVDNIVSNDKKVVDSSIVKTRVEGPSGSITHEQYKTPLNTANGKVYNIVKNIPTKVQTVLVADNIVSKGYKVITQEKYHQTSSNNNNGKVEFVVKDIPSKIQNSNIDVTSPIQKTSIVGPSGSITQEQYLQNSINNDRKVYNFGKNVPSKVQNVVVTKYVDSLGNQLVDSPIRKTSVVGPSGTITKNEYYQTAPNRYNGIVYKVNNSPLQVTDVLVEKNVINQGNAVVGSPIEKTSVLGPSGSITQVKYHNTSPQRDNGKVFTVVKNVPSKVQNIFVTENIPSQVNQVVEKTNVVGPSGKITQEKFLQNLLNGEYGKVYYGVKNVPNVHNILENGNVLVSKEETRVVGPSGSITQERYYPSQKYNENNKISHVITSTANENTYHYVNNVPVSDDFVVVPHSSSFSSDAKVTTTSGVGPSGITTSHSPVSLSYVLPQNGVVYIAAPSSDENQNTGSSLDETDCDDDSDSNTNHQVDEYHGKEFATGITYSIEGLGNSENFAAYGQPLINNIGLVYEHRKPVAQENVIYIHTNNLEQSTPTISRLEDVNYPPIPKYPNIAATDC